MSDNTNSLGMDDEKLARLKSRIKQRNDRTLNSLQNISLEPIDNLEPQILEKNGEEIKTFGVITPQEAAKFARISQITGSEIIVVGSASADQNRLAQVRFASGDVILTSEGNILPRPISDYDIVINPQKISQFEVASAYIEQNIILPKKEQRSDFKADYFYQNGEYDKDKPFTVFNNGKIQNYSPGKDIYYSSQGGGVRRS
ncbi:hypothetical protein BH10PAT1_BH10PAT1_0500 [soil metagenome]